MAPFHRLLSESSEMLNTVKPLSLYLLYAATTFGFSPRHGPHQLAQKSTSTYLPRKEESDTILPLVSGRLKSCALDGCDFFTSSARSRLLGNFLEACPTISATSVFEKP